MNPSIRIEIRMKQIVAWIILAIFVLGFFTPVGVFTGPVMGVWLVGTQRVRRGFVMLVAIGLVTGSIGIVRGAIHTGLGAGPGALIYVGWALAALVIGAVPFALHRIASPRLPGYAATLPFPVYAALLAVFERWFFISDAARAQIEHVPAILTPLADILSPAAATFLICWAASTLVWAWNQEFKAEKIRLGMGIFLTACFTVFGLETSGRVWSSAGAALLASAVFNWLCVAAGVGFVAWVLISELRRKAWQCGPETLSILRSPVSGEALQLKTEGRIQALVSDGGERFPVRDRIPDLRRPEDLTGDNGRYNQLYETIGGFYDDIQRVVCALQGFDRDAYMMSYMSLLEAKAGDSVLETSVGTGLNFKYLPTGVKLMGLDLSPEMLVRCAANMSRWDMEAALLLGNAESLPFADESFDVVFHVGGINFFNDRSKAIAEMIRVARPGSKILIADETEEHVKEMYERSAVTSRYFKNRKEPVKPPVDLVPPEMQEIRLETLKPMGKNRFYALTFRKPGAAVEECAVDGERPGTALPGI
jgi:ubiquinone/menaquinone biosynthesis C-methylase UbiE